MSEFATSIRLSAAIIRRVKRAAKRANRNPSQLATEALEWYFQVCSLPDEVPTQAELRAIRHGREAYKKGDYITLDEYRRKEELARRPNRRRAKIS
jgi:predicted transcriptional regulator